MYFTFTPRFLPPKGPRPAAQRIGLALALSLFGMGSSCLNPPKPPLASESVENKAKAIRNFLADALHPKSEYRKLGSEALEATCLDHAETLWLLANEPATLKATGLLPKVQSILKEQTYPLSGVSTDEIRQILKSMERPAFNKLEAALDESLKAFKFSEIDSIKQLEEIELPKMGSHWPSFLRIILTQYFDNLEPVDKKRVIASLLKNSHPGSSQDDYDNEMLLALVYGSGPFFHKAIQLLSDYLEPKGDAKLQKLKVGLAKVKDGLPHIEDYDIEQYVKEIEKATLHEDGSYKHVKITRSLGAASVGQAFLVDLKTMKGVDTLSSRVAVIKFMRPDIEQIAARESKFFKSSANSISKVESVNKRMLESYNELEKEIFEEMDYTLEVERLKKGNRIYPPGQMIQTVKLIEDIPHTKHYMAMELAPGRTFKSIELVLPLSDERAKIKAKVDQIAKGIMLEELAGRYIQDALYPDSYFHNGVRVHQSGFFHGDLHEGNLLLKVEQSVYDSFAKLEDVTKEAIKSLLHPWFGDWPIQLTIIDFGNAHSLAPAERSGMLNLFISATGISQSAEGFLDAFNLLASKSKANGSSSSAATIKKLGYKKILSILKSQTFVGDDSKMPHTVIGEAIDTIMDNDYPIPASIIAFNRSLAMIDNSFHEVNRNIKEAKWNSIQQFSMRDSVQAILASCLVKKHFSLSYTTLYPANYFRCEVNDPDIGLNQHNITGIQGKMVPYLKKYPDNPLSSEVIYRTLSLVMDSLEPAEVPQ